MTTREAFTTTQTTEITENVYDASGALTEDLTQAQDATTQATSYFLSGATPGAVTFTMNVDVDVNANPPQLRGRSCAVAGAHATVPLVGSGLVWAFPTGGACVGSKSCRMLALASIMTT
jgi:hypothetical protein